MDFNEVFILIFNFLKNRLFIGNPKNKYFYRIYLLYIYECESNSNLFKKR